MGGVGSFRLIWRKQALSPVQRVIDSLCWVGSWSVPKSLTSKSPHDEGALDLLPWFWELLPQPVRFDKRANAPRPTVIRCKGVKLY